MKHMFLAILLCTLVACTTTKADQVQQKQFLKVCHWDYEPSTECEKLHGKNIKFTGALYLPNNKMIAKLFPLGTDVPSHDDDILWDKLPEDGPEEIILRLLDSHDFSKFHQKNVEVIGTINTKCITRGRKLSEKTERVNKSKSSEDEITISMLTGFCHYYSEYITDVKILEINQ